MGQVAAGINGHLPVLAQLHQLPLLLAGDLVGSGGRVDAPAGHHDRLHAGRQQLDQRPLRRVVRQQGKIAGDAVVELLLAQGGLQVDLRMVAVLFHVAEVAGCAQRQRAADAEVGKQHLALLVEDGLAVLKQGQRHIFQGQSHHLLAVRVMADQTHQAGHRLHDGVPGLLGQFVAVAGGAGRRVAQAARSHQHGIGAVLPAGGSPHPDAAAGRTGLFLFGVARVLRRRRGSLLNRGQRLQQQFLGPVADDAGLLGVAQQRLTDLLGPV